MYNAISHSNYHDHFIRAAIVVDQYALHAKKGFHIYKISKPSLQRTTWDSSLFVLRRPQEENILTVTEPYYNREAMPQKYSSYLKSGESQLKENMLGFLLHSVTCMEMTCLPLHC